MTALIFDLPAELLDRIYQHLDSPGQAGDLIVKREDLYNVSLTCKHIRHSILPLLFRRVTLSLRWAGDELVKPRLATLRKERPDLTQHIRTVHLRNDLHLGRPNEYSILVLPIDSDWLVPEAPYFASSPHYTDLLASHRRHIDMLLTQLANETYGDSALKVTGSNAAAETAIKKITWMPNCSMALSFQQLKEAGDETPISLRRKADAIAVAMLCLPATVTSLVFESRSNVERAQHEFSLHLAAAAFHIFGPRLVALTMIAAAHGSGNNSTPEPFSILRPNAITHLTALKRLTLASSSFIYDATNFVSAPLRLGYLLHHYTRWRAVSPSTLTRLEFRNIHTCNDDLERILDIAKSMTRLKILNFQGIWMTIERHGSLYQPSPHHPTHTQPNPAPRAQELTWLNFAIALHREMPATQLHFSTISMARHGVAGISPVPESALTWIMHEAVFLGADIDYEREQRLVEDFESFIPLWTAEDSERGLNAAADRVKSGGMLADAAMSRRWRNATTVVRDEGEWATM